MSYMVCLGECFACKRPMSFNPDKVPSIRDKNNKKQPVCLHCIEQANPIRKEKGLPPIVPLPGAYEPEECP